MNPMARSHLPQAEAEFLRTLHPHHMQCLRARTRQLRDAGWTLRAIGEPMNAPRSTVRSWENHPDASRDFASLECGEHTPDLPSPPGIRPAPFMSTSTHTPSSPTPTFSSAAPTHRVRALSVDVPPDDQARIANLAPLARRVRGGTPLSSPYRQAKRELNELLAYYDTRGVPTQRLAELAGVTYRAMKVRLDEYSSSTIAS